MIPFEVVLCIFPHHARLTFEADEDCEGMELNAMHFIFSEMHLAMIDRKIPPYAPFITRLILDKGIEGEFAIEEDIPFEGVEAHTLIKLYKKTAVVGMTNGACHRPSYLTAGVPGVSTA
jgi:hypothetical protein